MGRSKTFNFERHIEKLHGANQFAAYKKEREELKLNENKVPKQKRAKARQPLKRKSPFDSATTSGSASSSRTPPMKKTKQTSMRAFMGKDAVLKACGAMVVEDGRPFSNVDTRCMQWFIFWGRKGVGDTSTVVIDSVKVRQKVQSEAEEYRTHLKKSMKGKVVHLSTDMATKDGRCFIGEKILSHSLKKFLKFLHF